MSVSTETSPTEPEKEKFIPTPIEMNSYECQQEPVSTIDIIIISQKGEYLNTSQKNHWEMPIQFKNVNLPNFPVTELPVVISDYVRAVAETVAVPISRLCEYGYMREQSNEYNGTGRPHANSWEISPMAYENL